MSEQVKTELADRRHQQVAVVLSRRISAAAAVIFLASMATSDRSVRSLAGLACLFVMALVGNLTLNRLLLRVGTTPAELIRTAFNIGLCVSCGHFGNWAPAVWLWLPFQALVMSMVERLSRLTLALFAIAFCSAGIAEGASPVYALLACLTALGIVTLTEPHLNEMRFMLSEVEERRRELEQAHAETARAHEELRQQVAEGERMEFQLRQAQKLESVGRLASGMAHEINTPVQFISDSVRFLSDATTDLTALIGSYKRSADEARSIDALRAELAKADDEADLTYLVENIPTAFERSLDGLSRIAGIVSSMKEFAHPDARRKAPADLNRAVQNTLAVAANEYRFVASVKTDFGVLPMVECHVGEINQVVLNIVVNGAHAIADRIKGTAQRGVIEVSTRTEAAEVVISVKDTGGGIPLEIRDKVFDPFFTTKAVGRGSGQGLAIAWSIVVEKHQGTLTFTVDPDAGTTTFFIRLPVSPRHAEPLRAATAVVQGNSTPIAATSTAFGSAASESTITAMAVCLSGK